MRKVIGIGEIILDIIFKDGQPFAAVPGGSVFNAMVSLSRLGLPVSFIGEVGNDRVGRMITGFMQANGMTTQHIDFFSDRKTPVSLAFLDETKNAEYVFYTSQPTSLSNISLPAIHQDDIVVFGSFYALNPVYRQRIAELLDYAKSQKAIIFYDPNFRKAHIHEAIRVRPSIIENFEFADLIRASDEDFFNIFGKTDMSQVYREEIQFYCKRLIATHGAEGVSLFTESMQSQYAARPVEPVSTIGAGDNFNAGIIYGLIKHEIGYQDLTSIDSAVWDQMIRYGIDFATEVCLSDSNYLSSEF
ncbi:MAG: carbohydrate kinase, partial [Tannerella sp.]|nr:carbohydrate kinase [Tannerella sp.]